MIKTLYEKLIRLDETDSTNAEALRRSGSIRGDFAVCAEYQSAGRGRMGRSFESPKGAGLYLSVLEYRAVSPDLTARVGVAAAKSIEKCCGLETEIKWPNDIQCGGKKLCGILCERVPLKKASGEYTDAVIIGIGINLSQSEEELGELSDIATSLRLCGRSCDKEELLKALLSELDLMLSGYDRAEGEASRSSYLAYYREHSNCTDRDIYLIKDDKKIPAYAAGIGDDFELIVRRDDGSFEHINSGEISLRFRD